MVTRSDKGTTVETSVTSSEVAAFTVLVIWSGLSVWNMFWSFVTDFIFWSDGNTTFSDGFPSLEDRLVCGETSDEVEWFV
ncbi:hypothetical protein WICPIJ_004173 [Wickerhamomyces pijperi]|uniref:Transmembrane protein n=1 Tax=Wickerhamomyces pijperi TaxID=599730 RepID=A0A9P8Q890_WICPI|nr:hypothetical protein WICPIJ_004173 [Wickerhamomyces pijperi]